MTQPNSPKVLLLSVFMRFILITYLALMGSHSLAQEQVEALLYKRCESCHNDYDLSGNWSIEEIQLSDVGLGKNQTLWEAILKSVAMGDMPPSEKTPLTAIEKSLLLDWLQTALDNYSEQHPNPGRATLRRLNRYEYANSVRDLLGINIDISGWLPGDDSGYGFDNNADVLGISTSLLERYVSVAGKVSRLATGASFDVATKVSYLVPKDGPVKNSGVPAFDLRMSDDLPLDSRGGGSFTFYAPTTAEYEIAGFINANTNNEVDRLAIHRYHYRALLAAGNHTIGMSFRKQLALSEAIPKVRKGTDLVVLPKQAASLLDLDFIVDGRRVHTTKVPSYHMSARFSQAAFLRDVLEMEVIGPLQDKSQGNEQVLNARGEEQNNKKIFTCLPQGNNRQSERACARQILTNLAAQAYRRLVSENDIQPLLEVYEQVRGSAGFKASIATSIQALLVSPSFFYLQEPTPTGVAPGDVYRINDFEFAARLALFLWSSLPDKTLSDLAASGTLRQPDILKAQIKRMLASQKAQALTTNFAGQWLYLRNLDYHFPDVFEFPQFNVVLKQSIKKETELFFSRMVKDNGSILDFLNADYSYLNEPLAEHYGIEGVKGQAFRKVQLDNTAHRGGLLGQASILTLTSNPNHTSPVKRGKWILDNLLAASPPPPPADVPALVAEHNGVVLSAREQLNVHRKNPICAACHVRMDPLGLALENYDAIGAYRTQYAGNTIDASAKMPDGSQFEGLSGLQTILWDRQARFTHAFVERLLTYALGRGLEAYDQPRVRKIAQQAKKQHLRMHSIIESVVTSMPFNYKKAPEVNDEKQHFASAP